MVRPTFTLAVANAISVLECVAEALSEGALGAEARDAALALIEHEPDWNPDRRPDEPRNPFDPGETYEQRRDRLTERAQKALMAAERLREPLEAAYRRVREERDSDLQAVADWYGCTPAVAAAHMHVEMPA